MFFPIPVPEGMSRREKMLVSMVGLLLLSQYLPNTLHNLERTEQVSFLKENIAKAQVALFYGEDVQVCCGVYSCGVKPVEDDFNVGECTSVNGSSCVCREYDIVVRKP